MYCIVFETPLSSNWCKLSNLQIIIMFYVSPLDFTDTRVSQDQVLCMCWLEHVWIFARPAVKKEFTFRASSQCHHVRDFYVPSYNIPTPYNVQYIGRVCTYCSHRIQMMTCICAIIKVGIDRRAWDIGWVGTWKSMCEGYFAKPQVFGNDKIRARKPVTVGRKRGLGVVQERNEPCALHFPCGKNPGHQNSLTELPVGLTKGGFFLPEMSISFMKTKFCIYFS